MLVGVPIEYLLAGPVLVTAALFVFADRKPKVDDRSLKEIRRKNATKETPLMGWGTIAMGIVVVGLAGLLVQKLIENGSMLSIIRQFSIL